jgi:hypothetical protein
VFRRSTFWFPSVVSFPTFCALALLIPIHRRDVAAAVHRGPLFVNRGQSFPRNMRWVVGVVLGECDLNLPCSSFLLSLRITIDWSSAVRLASGHSQSIATIGGMASDAWRTTASARQQRWPLIKALLSREWGAPPRCTDREDNTLTRRVG